VRWFGHGREEEREAQREAQEQEAREWLQAHETEKLARAAAREAQASQARGGGITHTGSEDITISGQAFGHGAEVRNVRQGEAGSHGGGRGGGPRQGERGGAEHSGHEGPYIVSTGSGSVNVNRSAVGNNIHMINYGDRESVVTEAPQAGQELEAGQ
jgi:hypothetical protein